MEQAAVNGLTKPRFVDTKAKLQDGRLGPLENARRLLNADIPSGVTLDTVLQPHFWVHYARQLTPGDLIFAFCEDGSWASVLWVMFVGEGEVRVSAVLFKETDASPETDETSDMHEIKWKGPGMKFAIVHKQTGAIVKDRLYPKSAAVGYLRDHLRKLQS